MTKERLLFNEQGYILFKKALVGSSTYQELQQSIIALAENRLKRFAFATPIQNRKSLDKTLIEAFNADKRHVSFIYDTMRFVPTLAGLLGSKEVVGLAKLVLGAESEDLIALNNLNLRIDMPGKDWTENLPWHQDWPYNNPLYYQGNSVACWIPVFAVLKTAGPIKLLSGSQKLGEVEHEKEKMPDDHERVDSFRYRVSETVIAKIAKAEVEFEYEEGDVLFFDLNLIHKSGINISSDIIRWSVQARYHNTASKHFLSKYG